MLACLWLGNLESMKGLTCIWELLGHGELPVIMLQSKQPNAYVSPALLSVPSTSSSARDPACQGQSWGHEHLQSMHCCHSGWQCRE